MVADGVLTAIRSCSELSEDDRVAIYNAAQRALGELVADVSTDPALAPQLFLAESIVANDYNPNKVASPELDLLEESIRADGITMCVVVMPSEGGLHVVIDGFHRRLVAVDRLGRKYLPCSVINRDLVDRMASTIRHNRARGKHQVELMASIVREMLDLGLDDDQMATALGMSVEELLRLRQMVGAAKIMAGAEYSQSWGNIE